MSSALVAPWWNNPAQVLPTTATAISMVPARALELDLAGNIHDALSAPVCREHDVGLVTLDARQHRLALALGVDSAYLLAPRRAVSVPRRRPQDDWSVTGCGGIGRR